MDNVSTEKIVLCLVVVIVIALIIYQHFSYQHELDLIKNSVNSTGGNKFDKTQVCPSCPSCPENQDFQKKISINLNDRNNELGGINPYRDYDYKTLGDPLIPPYKRDDYNLPFPTIHTRGLPTQFKKMGLLVDSEAPNTDQYKFMILMGRQKYPNANFYDYYVTENKSDGLLKIDLPDLHKELYTDDEVRVADVDKTFKVKIDRNVGVDYSPFVY